MEKVSGESTAGGGGLSTTTTTKEGTKSQRKEERKKKKSATSALTAREPDSGGYIIRYVVVVGRFYTAVFSAVERTHCTLVACDSERVTVLFFYVFFLNIFLARFEYPPKRCTYSGVWLLHSRCHVKLLPSRRVLCTPYNRAPCHITSCKATHVRCICV